MGTYSGFSSSLWSSCCLEVFHVGSRLPTCVTCSTVLMPFRALCKCVFFDLHHCLGPFFAFFSLYQSCQSPPPFWSNGPIPYIVHFSYYVTLGVSPTIALLWPLAWAVTDPTQMSRTGTLHLASAQPSTISLDVNMDLEEIHFLQVLVCRTLKNIPQTVSLLCLKTYGVLDVLAVTDSFFHVVNKFLLDSLGLCTCASFMPTAVWLFSL